MTTALERVKRLEKAAEPRDGPDAIMERLEPFHLGDRTVENRLNVRSEVRLLRRDPLDRLIEVLNDSEALYLHGDVGRYVQAYECFGLSAWRCLLNVSVGTRYHRQIRPLVGGRRSLPPDKRKLSEEFRARAPFFRLDLINLILHARIVLDRSVAFSRRFLSGRSLPSFTSFAEHRKFFAKHPEAFEQDHGPYSQYLRKGPSWFDMPIKAIRDKMIVHSGSQHFQGVVYPSEHDMGLVFVLERRKPWSDFPETSTVHVSARRLILNVREYLQWYNKYALGALENVALRKLGTAVAETRNRA